MTTIKKDKVEVQDEALAEILPLHRCGVGITMGVGKTFLGLRHMDANYNDNCRFLVAGPKLEVFTTWKEEAVKHSLVYLIDHFDFTTYLSLNKMNPNDYDII